MSKLILPELEFWESMYWPEGVPRYMELAYRPLYETLVAQWAEQDPHRPALVAGGEVVSFGELDDRARRVAQEIAADGGRPVRISAKGIYRVISYLAATGFDRPMLLDDGERSPGTSLDDAAVESMLAKNGATRRDYATSLDDPLFIRRARPQDSIGTAVSKKGYEANILSFNAFMGLGRTGLLVYPASKLNDTFHVFAALARGSPVVLADEPADLSAALDLEGSYYMYTDETGIGLLNDAPNAIKALKDRLGWAMPYGGTARCPGLGRGVGMPLLEAYELPELGVLLSNHPSWPIPHSMGLPITNVEARLLKQSKLIKSWSEVALEAGQVRELAVAGEFLEGMSCDEAGKGHIVTVRRLSEGKNRWLATGDLAEMDENGIFYPRPATP